MASLTTDERSPYWICCFGCSDGRQLKKSTKVRIKPLPGERKASGRKKNAADLEREAWEVCMAMQRAEDLAGSGNATERQLRRVLSETLARIGAAPLESPSVRQWLEQWLASKKSVVADSTLVRYRQTVRDFLAYLGPRSDLKLETVTPAAIAGFRDHLRDQGLNTTTIRKTLKGFLSSPFHLAWRMGKLASNPVAFVQIESARDKRATRRSRKPFTAEQVAKLVAAAPTEEWRTLITIGYFAGARLRDCLSLTSENIDMDRGTLIFVQRKTGAEIMVPMHDAIRARLTVVPRELFPTLSRLREGGRRGLSTQFQAIVRAAGIENTIVQMRNEKRGRTIRSLTFHSLRHAFVSALANAGVPQELRQALSGHHDSASHARYTHHEIDRLRDAMAKIPSL